MNETHVPNLTVLSKTGNRAVCLCQCGNTYDVSYQDALKSRLGHLCPLCKSPANQPLTQELVKKFLHYDPVTGIVTNLVDRWGCHKGEQVGTVGNHGYLHLNFGGETYLLHRLIWLYMTGLLPEQVDHEDHNKLNNAWNNLREVTNTVNSMNCSVSKNSTTKVNGVSFMKSKGKYRAYIMVNKKQISLGLYVNIEDAIAARLAADIKYGFHTNHGT